MANSIMAIDSIKSKPFFLFTNTKYLMALEEFAKKIIGLFIVEIKLKEKYHQFNVLIL